MASITTKTHEDTNMNMDTGHKRPLRADDLFNLALIGDVTISPDGRMICYVQTRMDRAENAYRSDLWIVPTDGSAPPRQFTHVPRTVASPRYAPDGTCLAFLADRDEKGKRQLWLLPLSGGEATRLTSGETGVNDYAWSPDSTRLVFTRGEKHPPTPEATQPELPAARVTDDVLTLDRIRNKADGRGWIFNTRTHLWLVDVHGDETRLTGGDYDETSPAWSPDGTQIAFVSRRIADADFVNTSDLYVIPAGGGEVRLVPTPPGPLDAPVWSPDGTSVAYTGTGQANAVGSNTDLWIVPAHPVNMADPAHASTARALTNHMDLSIGLDVSSDSRASLSGMRPTWSPDGTSLSVVASTRGVSPLWHVTREGEMTQIIGGVRQVQSVAADAAGSTFALNIGDARSPGEVYVVSEGQELRRLTDVNGVFFDTVTLVTPEAFTYTGPKGWEVQGWLMKPTGYTEGQTYPCVLEIHGGPHTAYGEAFIYEFQLLAAQGWGVLALNPRGSTGYGEAFTKASDDDWGGDDYRDLMAGMDAALAHVPWIDPARLGVTGGSYGGYMTNWIITQTDRFRAAVTQRSICNMVSKWGTSDNGYFGNDLQWGGPPWENMAFYLDRSPLTHVKNVVTPLLILHSERDLRCPIEQGEQFFTALSYLRREVQMVRFPDEGHELSRSGQPLHRLERLNRIIGWFRDHL